MPRVSFCQISVSPPFSFLQRPRLVQRLIILRMVSRLAPSPRSRLASKRVNCSGELGEEQGVTGFIDRDSLVVLLLLVETLAKHLHLHGEHVVGYSLGKTDEASCLLFGLLQDVEDDATTEADDGRTATIYIHHTGRHSPGRAVSLLRAIGRTPRTYGGSSITP